MLSDTLSDAIQEIERYQSEIPDAYDGFRDHIEFVKKVMGSLRELLDGLPVVDSPLGLADRLTDEEKEWWRACCEANVARWVERLLLLGLVSGEELAGNLADAIERHPVLLAEDQCRDRAALDRRAFLECLHVWSLLSDVEPVRGRLDEIVPRLEHDGHPLPVDYAERLQLPFGATFADGVRTVRAKLDAEATRREVFRLVCECWNERATDIARDAIADLLHDNPECAHALVGPLADYSDIWLEEFACAAFGLPPCEGVEYDHEFLLSEGRKALAAREQSATTKDGPRCLS